MEASCGPPQLFAGVIVERTPVLMPDPEDWEMEMWELQARLEVYDGFEYPKIVGGGTSAEADAKATPKQIPEEIQKLMNRETDADRANDTKSMERKLAEALYLLVKPTPADPWQLPRSPIDGDDEYLREACERVIAEQCGEELYTYIMGNAPVGFWDTNSGTDLRREFFMKAIIVDLYNSGPVDPSLTGDHIWVSKEELPNYITDDDDYLTFLQKLL